MLKKLARWGAGLVLAASLVGLLSWPWWLELFVHFRSQYVLLLMVLAPLLWRARDGVAAGLWLLSMGVNLAYLTPYYWGHRAPGPANAHLVLANVLAINRTPQRVVSFLEASHPDVIALLEVTPAWLEPLKPILRNYPGQVLRPHPQFFGMVLLSRHPLTQVEILQSDGPPVLIADTVVAGKSLHVVAAHPVPPVYGQASQSRDRMIQTLAQHLAICPRPFVLLGDLNNTPWSPSLSPLPQSARNTRRGFGLLPSWPTLLPLPMRIPIDQCFVSEELGVVQCQLGPDVGSDHFPLVVDVQL